MQNPIMILQKENIPERQHVFQAPRALIPLTFQSVSYFQITLNTTESTFVVPILIPNPEVWHKGAWPHVSSPDDFCWLLDLNICWQKEGILHPQGSSKLKIVACEGATMQKSKLCTHPWSQTTLYHHDSKQVSRTAHSQKKWSPAKMKQNQILLTV